MAQAVRVHPLEGPRGGPSENSQTRWDGTKIQWAPRVPRELIRRLYENDANGTPDDVLVDDVAWRLFERCQDILRVTEAADGRATYPVCEGVISHDGGRQTVLECGCGWGLSWLEYQASYQKK